MQNIDVKANLLAVLGDIETQILKAGRKPGCVKLLAVSKFHTAEAVVQAVSAGQKMFGENRVQEACAKFPDIFSKYPQVVLHLIGTLQKNKAGHAVKIASCIESVDRLELIQELEKHCAKENKKIQIFFEYHTGEESKSGYTDFQSLYDSIAYIASGNAPHLVPCGFMTMAPFTQDEKIIHKSFSTLRETSEKLKSQFPQFEMNELSMGMSADYRIAIQEGSTEVRIGTAIFGERDYSKA